MDAQFKKGVLEMCILFQLVKEDMYGYEIMKIVKDIFPDVYDGSIYTILRRLNSEGNTEIYMKDVPSGGPPRKYYKVTDSGKLYLENAIKEWKHLVRNIELLGI